MTVKQRIADRVLPWAAANATVWPSQHAVHLELGQALTDLHEIHMDQMDQMREALEKIEKRSDARELPCVMALESIHWWARKGLGR